MRIFSHLGGEEVGDTEPAREAEDEGVVFLRLLLCLSRFPPLHTHPPLRPRHAVSTPPAPVPHPPPPPPHPLRPLLHPLFRSLDQIPPLLAPATAPTTPRLVSATERGIESLQWMRSMTLICSQRSPASSWGRGGRFVRVACPRGRCRAVHHLRRSLRGNHVL